MATIFLSAGVPSVDNELYHETANPFLIQAAVRELVVSTIRDHRITWGGHPAITPMIWSICSDIGVNYAEKVTLFESNFFADVFPEESEEFKNVFVVDAIEGDRDASLAKLRAAMLEHAHYSAAVFIGGMEGVEIEYELFKRAYPDALALLVPSTGGAALRIAEQAGETNPETLTDIDFANLFHYQLLPTLVEPARPADNGSQQGQRTDG